MKLRLSLAGALLLTPALGLLSAAPAGATESASVDAEFACTSVSVSSERHDLSNVVLRFADGDQRFEGLKGRTATFSGTGQYAGDPITAVFVKAGSNASTAGPGYGEQIDAPAGSCGTTAATTAPTEDGDAPKGDAVKDDETPTSGTGGNEGGDAVVDADVACDGRSVVVTSTKDLSNVVLVLSDGTHVKHDGLSGDEGTFSAPSGTTIVAVYVKSGANHSGDGPGYGQRIDAESCEEVTPAVVTPTIVKAATVTPATVTPATVTPAPAEVASSEVLAAAAVAETPAAPVLEATPARETAQVLGVSLERSAPAVTAAGLARTGIELTTMVLVAVALLLGGIVLTRRGAAKRSA